MTVETTITLHPLVNDTSRLCTQWLTTASVQSNCSKDRYGHPLFLSSPLAIGFCKRWIFQSQSRSLRSFQLLVGFSFWCRAWSLNHSEASVDFSNSTLYDVYDFVGEDDVFLIRFGWFFVVLSGPHFEMRFRLPDLRIYSGSIYSKCLVISSKHFNLRNTPINSIHLQKISLFATTMMGIVTGAFFLNLWFYPIHRNSNKINYSVTSLASKIDDKLYWKDLRKVPLEIQACNALSHL